MVGPFIGVIIIFNGFRIVYERTLRVATGWEDPDTPEFEEKKIQKFIENNKDAEVIKLNPNPENYF